MFLVGVLSFGVRCFHGLCCSERRVSWSFSLSCSSVRKAGGRLRAVCGGWFVTCDQELLCVIRSGSIIARRDGALLHMIYSSDNV